MKIDMCSGAIVCHPLESSHHQDVDLLENSPVQLAAEPDHQSQCPPSLCLAWNERCVSCSPAFGDIPPKLSARPLRHTERACEHWCEGSPYHRISTQMFLPNLSTYSASSILIPATNQEMLPDLRPLSFSFSVRFSMMSACDGTA